MWRNLNYICGEGVFFFFSSFQNTRALIKPAMFLAAYWALSGRWKKSHLVCLMTGFLSSNHTEGVPGKSRQLLSAGHRKENHHFSTCIIVFESSQPLFWRHCVLVWSVQASTNTVFSRNADFGNVHLLFTNLLHSFLFSEICYWQKGNKTIIIKPIPY